ncbi:endonuclease/exonuclease/phosphatase family protein [Patescibacteria group bacterium]|jgi:endonuclease/exonuclease/phosphatase family metal-dependent hydrolase|nr:endonuclease/exonuclease/phosphatase family protein [Patescibacteria group bacterium]
MTPIRLLTFNTGLFQFRLFNRGLIDPIVYPDIRASHLVDALLETGADIIALQEVFTFEHLRLLQNGLATTYPHHATTHHRPDLYHFKYHTGLSIFSKFPLESHEIHRFQAVPFEEGLWMDKGFQTVTAITPLGRINLGNVHLTSGGMHRNPEAPSMIAVRNRQIEDVVEKLHARSGDLRIILGDFNSGPGSSPENYHHALSQGYIDLFEKHPHPEEHVKTVTWELSNPLNAREFYKNPTLQRLDHILLDNASADHFDVHESKIILHEPRVHLPNGKSVTLSDHYGVTTVIGRKNTSI